MNKTAKNEMTFLTALKKDDSIKPNERIGFTFIRGPNKTARSGRKAYTYFFDTELIKTIEDMSTTSTTVAIEVLIKIALKHIADEKITIIDYVENGYPVLTK